MNTFNTMRPLTLLAALLASMTLVTPAIALEPTVPNHDRSLMREAQGEYLLDDGRSVKVSVGSRRLAVSVDESPAEQWRAQNTELLISPDGMRRLRLIRNVDGSVDRIAFETDRVR
ncbi:hypothetical protein LXT12_09080 [Pelomonas sp. P7]|uniref:Uncharacterized protein n=1 Tax=Pelomonas caseinilytica TaxID=2906763 RepID=A0ABS8X999_9BURK|nr:hypothetical protein [Pelomonas sp. P7]MCE4537401.1 hypothetical protein [Pelomonas sp. P7]